MPTSTKPKVLLLPKWYPNRLEPFDGNFIENHAKAISEFAEIAVIFVHSDSNSKKKFEVLESAPFGFSEIRVYYRKPSKKIPFVFKALSIVRYWKAQLKAYKILLEGFGEPDLVHIHVLTRPALLAYYLKLFKGIPYIISEHWSGYFKESGAYRGFFKKAATKFFVAQSSMLTAVSEYLRRAMESHDLKADYRIIPNVVATNTFVPTDKSENSSFKKIAHVSTLDIVPKNLPKILEVIAEVSKERSDFIFEIYGDGPDRKKIEEKVDQLGIGKLVSFYGNLPQKELAAAIAKADVLVLFSLYENQPCVMIEAWAAGIPVIAPAIGGIPEHLDRSRGMLIERNSKKALKKAIEKFLDNADGFDKSNIRKYATEHFSEKRIGSMFYNVYLEVIKKQER